MNRTVELTSALMDTYNRAPVEFVSGRGAILVDTAGREYIDMVAGIAVASVGHSHPRVVDAISAQASRLIHVSNLYASSPQTELAGKLAELTGGMRSFFCNSGAEALECALKLARRWAGPARPRVIAAQGSFHGRTFGALSLTGQPAKQSPFLPLVPGVEHVPYDDIPALAAALSDDVAAVVLEPIQGEGGVIVPSDGYLTQTRELCDRSGALLVLDEVQTGLARTGDLFAYENEGARPDILCLAKALAGGLPMGACLAIPEVAVAFQPGDHATTFGGGPVQSAAALTVLQIIEDEGLVQKGRLRGEHLARRLGTVFGSHNVRGRGLLVAAALEEPVASEVVAHASSRGVLINNTDAATLRFTPPLVITDEEIDRAIKVVEEAWHEVRTS